MIYPRWQDRNLKFHAMTWSAKFLNNLKLKFDEPKSIRTQAFQGFYLWLLKWKKIVT